MLLNIQRVESLDNPDLEPYRTLKRPLEHQQQGIFVAEGDKVVRRLLETPLCVLSILLTPSWFEEFKFLLEKRNESINVYLAEKNVMETIVGHQLHKGIMAIARIPEPHTIENILTTSPRPLFLVAVDGIMNSENLGVIVRNCASFGVHALLAGETSCDPYLRRSVRNSMGNIFSLPIVYLTNIANDLADMRSKFGVKIIAAHPREHSKAIGNVDLSGDCCIVLGNEGSGISESVLSVCDEAVTIPMRNGVDSINVGSASAVLLYEVQRQRNAK